MLALMTERKKNRLKGKNHRNKFGGFGKNNYLCTRFRKIAIKREIR